MRRQVLTVCLCLCDGWCLAAAVAGITTGSAGMAGASTASKVVVADVFLGLWDLGRPPLQARARVPSAAAAGESGWWAHGAAAQFPAGTAVAGRPEPAAVIGFSGAVGSVSWVQLGSRHCFHCLVFSVCSSPLTLRCTDVQTPLVSQCVGQRNLCWVQKLTCFVNTF